MSFKTKRYALVLLACFLPFPTACTKTGKNDIPAAESREDKAVIDLTELSSNMVYAQVYDMIMSPEKYRRKTVKMQGLFATRTDERTGKLLYGCVIQDALACCAQGIQFIPAEEMQYPQDFPTEGETITVTGTFDYETDGTVINCILRGAQTE